MVSLQMWHAGLSSITTKKLVGIKHFVSKKNHVSLKIVARIKVTKFEIACTVP